MKKNLLLILSLFIVANVFAQKALQTMAPKVQKKLVDNLNFRMAEGDTVLYWDCSNTLYIPEENSDDFSLMREEFDEQVPAAYTDLSDEDAALLTQFYWDYENVNGTSDPIIPNGTLEVDWDANTDPNVPDTAWHFAAWSWFTNPAVPADNWIGWGPIRIPEGGAEFKFHHRSRESYIDGFDVYFTTGGMEPYNDVDPGVTDIAYSRESYTSNDPKFSASDTIWTERTVSMNDFAGENVYITFHHNALDMEVLRIDNFLILETDNMSMDENELNDISIFPNPSNGVFTVSSLEVAEYKIEVINVLGELISTSLVHGMLNEKFNMSDFTSGLYFVKVSNGVKENTQRIIIK